jgi:uncharacterized protein (DUF1330 family)
MNRGLIGFLTFLAVLVLGFGVAAYLLGPNVLAFVFHEERRTEPVVIVSLLDFADEQHEAAYQQGFERPAAALIKTLGGHSIWKASAGDVVRGQVLDGWSALELVGYPSRSAFIELVTSSDYRSLLDARAQSLKRSAVLAAAPAVAFDTQGTQAQAVRFLTGAHDDSIAVYEAKWLAEDEKLLAEHAGKLIWRAQLNPLVAEPEQRFGEMLIYGFSDAQHREDWAADAERETLQTLQRRLFKRDVLVLANAQSPADTPEPAAANVDPDAGLAGGADESPQEGAAEAPAPASQQAPANAP